MVHQRHHGLASIRGGVVSTSRDPMTSLPVHRSTLRYLQELKTGPETWDAFLVRLLAFHENTLSAELRTELGRRSRGARVPLRGLANC